MCPHIEGRGYCTQFSIVALATGEAAHDRWFVVEAWGGVKALLGELGEHGRMDM